MAPSTELIIGASDGDHVLVRPTGRRHPGLFDYWDGNWVDCEIEMAAGGFRGAFRADLRSEELCGFLGELEMLADTLEGTASLSTMEGQIGLTLAGDPSGVVRVSGDAVDEAAPGNRLAFTFAIDAAGLRGICSSLEALLAVYPVIGAPDPGSEPGQAE
jgi:hypothetical protein